MNNTLDSFLISYQLLSKKQKKIFSYLQYLCKNFRVVYPGHARIAKMANCCRDTVIKTLKLFTNNGWIGSMRRCYRSSVYFMDDSLIDLDLNKTETFRKTPQEPSQTPQEEILKKEIQIEESTQNSTPNSTQNSTLIITNRGVKGTNTLQSQFVQHNQCKETRHILENIGMSGKDLWCLARYGLRIVSMAIEDLKTRKAPTAIRNIAAWLTQRCKSYKLC